MTRKSAASKYSSSSLMKSTIHILEMKGIKTSKPTEVVQWSLVSPVVRPDQNKRHVLFTSDQESDCRQALTEQLCFPIVLHVCFISNATA